MEKSINPSIITYKEYSIDKGNGRFRRIAEPSEELKVVQIEIVDMLKNIIKIPDVAVGFVDKKRIRDGALIHKDCKSILNMDLSNFFEHITVSKLKDRLTFELKEVTDNLIGNLFRKICVNGNAILGLETNENCKEAIIEFIVTMCTFKESTPQGAPSSPFLSNVIMKQLDITLKRKLGVLSEEDDVTLTLSRYADDISIGSSSEKYDFTKARVMLELEIDILDLKINRKKTKLSRGSQKKEVTGITISDFRKENHRYVVWLEDIEENGELKRYICHYEREKTSLAWSRRKRMHVRAMLFNTFMKLRDGAKVDKLNMKVISGNLSMLYANDYGNFLKYRKELNLIKGLGALRAEPAKQLIRFLDKMHGNKEEYILENGFIHIPKGGLLEHYNCLSLREKGHEEVLLTMLKSKGFSVRDTPITQTIVIESIPAYSSKDDAQEDSALTTE